MKFLSRSIYTWGNGLKSQLGHGDLSSVLRPKLLSKLAQAKVLGIGSGITHSVALIEESGKGNVYIWGDNYYGQAGLIPEMMNGLFESEDDEFSEPCHLVEGFDGQSIQSISVGDFHALALGENKKVYAWGAGVLGNGTNLFSSRPMLLDLEDISYLCVRGNTSLAIGQHVYIWGELHNEQSLVPLTVKIPIDTTSIKSIDVSSNRMVIATQNELLLMGNGAAICVRPYPNNPPLLDLSIRTAPLQWEKLFYRMPFNGIKKVQLHGDQVFVLDESGHLSMVNEAGELLPLSIKGNALPISNMHIGANTAIFSTATHLYTYEGIPPVHQRPASGSKIYKWFTRNDVPAIETPGVSVVDAIQTNDPKSYYVENHGLVSTCWDHFLAK
jgi:hypothetical protein